MGFPAPTAVLADTPIATYLPAPIKLDTVTQNHIASCLLNISGQARKNIMVEYFHLYQMEGEQRANL